MSQIQSLPPVVPLDTRTRVEVLKEHVSIPWTLWFMVAGMSMRVIGGIWDDAWHSSIGIDTSWAGPHVLIQMSPVLPLIACAYEIFFTNLASNNRSRDTA